MSLHRLIPLFERARLSDEPLALATVIRTGGSTYAKPGAQMLIARNGEYAGLLSGGCLEGDLREHAQTVIESGEARIVSYDMRSQDDHLFGLGAGCEGAMDILLTRCGPADGDWQPLADMAAAFSAARAHRVGFVTATRTPELVLGQLVGAEDGIASYVQGPVNRVLEFGKFDLFVLEVPPPLRLLLLGGGPDACPVAKLAEFLGWRVTVADHRPAYLEPGRFPADTRLVESAAAQIADALSLDEYFAAIVMSHHLDSDLHYLRALSGSSVPYVGLLGPAARREKLLGDLGASSSTLRGRLRAPVGLDIGGRTPEAIALSIVGEVQAALSGRGGRPFSETA